MKFRTVIYRVPIIKSSQPESRIESQLESQLESKLAAKVLLIIKEEEFGRHQIAIKLGHKGISGELNKQIKRLLGKNLIERTIQEKPNSRLLKYRLTLKALDLLHKLIGKKN